MSKKLNKEELKTPDAFITFSDKAAKYIETNKGSVFGLLGSALLVILGISVNTMVQKYKESEAQKALYGVEQLVEKYNEDNKAITGKTEQDFEKKYPALLSEFDEMIQSHPSTSATFLGAVSIAQLLSEYSLGSKAIAIVEDVRKGADKSTVFYGLLGMQLSKLYLEQDQSKEAIGVLEEIEAAQELSFLHASALLRKGVAYEKLGDRDLAQQTYTKVINEHAKSQSASIAKTYMRLLSTQGQ